MAINRANLSIEHFTLEQFPRARLERREGISTPISHPPLARLLKLLKYAMTPSESSRPGVSGVRRHNDGNPRRGIGLAGAASLARRNYRRT
jgi:hypothetical protein